MRIAKSLVIISQEMLYRRVYPPSAGGCFPFLASNIECFIETVVCKVVHIGIMLSFKHFKAAFSSRTLFMPALETTALKSELK